MCVLPFQGEGAAMPDGSIEDMRAALASLDRSLEPHPLRKMVSRWLDQADELLTVSRLKYPPGSYDRGMVNGQARQLAIAAKELLDFCETEGL